MTTRQGIENDNEHSCLQQTASTNNNVMFYKYSGPPKYGLGIVYQVFVKRGFLMYLNLYLFKFTRDS